jgi:hypothetical protein
VLRLRKNRGFAEGNNVGIRRCLSGNADYIVLLNQDTVVDPHWLSELVRAAQANPSVGVWNPMVYDYEGQALDAGFRSRAFQNPDFARDFGQGRLRDVYALPDATGSALMLGRRTIEAVGLFDPTYFAYYEETDLCRRARLAGFQVGLASRGRVRHWRATAHPEAMPWRSRHLRVRNEFLFTLKNPGQGLLRNALDDARLSLTRRYAGLTRRRLAVHLALTHLWMALNFPRIVLRRREEKRMIAKCEVRSAKWRPEEQRS